jgi:hypothetical protein
VFTEPLPTNGSTSYNIFKIVPVFNYLSTVIMIFGGSGGIAPLLLTSALDGSDWSDSRSGRFTPGKEPSVPIVWAGWPPEPVWKLWRRGAVKNMVLFCVAIGLYLREFV